MLSQHVLRHDGSWNPMPRLGEIADDRPWVSFGIMDLFVVQS